ncbi:Multimeric flavodoxin WrbA [Geosporobacter subterraneus DSM 17957]|uniref:Multimeric flavodoxin WrbA n=1 Tax=Geosporobacter subterraneus DSM 17957 TaxID=1121919 RepID=A0A1M6I8U1_9FIRM|nr:flavodoxin family protein [Geosporobacter subterraneus]SHJ30909.1 Multimeric flavodoxin WrbA [Geosporobacter subterraneus DSM 17957]
MRRKWLAVIGSPRRGKNTDLLVDWIIEGLKQMNINVEKYYLDSWLISSCNGCEYCIETGKCHIQDGISEIIEQMKIADGYIFSSPSYNYNMTAQMKALLDRTFCLNDYRDGWKSRLSPNKKAIIVGICKGKTQESMGFTVAGMEKALTELGIEILDIIEYYDTKNIPVENNVTIQEDIMNRIKHSVYF